MGAECSSRGPGGSPAACAATHRARVPHGRDEATRARPGPCRRAGRLATAGRVVYKNGLPERPPCRSSTPTRRSRSVGPRLCAIRRGRGARPRGGARHRAGRVRARGRRGPRVHPPVRRWSPAGRRGSSSGRRSAASTLRRRRPARQALAAKRSRTSTAASETPRCRRSDAIGATLAQVVRLLARAPLRAGRHGALPVVEAHDGDPGEGGGRADVYVCSLRREGTGEMDVWTLAACHVAASRACGLVAQAGGRGDGVAGRRRCPPWTRSAAPATRMSRRRSARVRPGRHRHDRWPERDLVLVGRRGDPAEVASDLIAQAEHDTRAASVLVTPSARLADATSRLSRQLVDHPERDRAALARRPRRARGLEDLAEAVRLADAFAPEHLRCTLATRRRSSEALPRGRGVRRNEHAGGRGRLLAGPSYVLPTAGTARFASPLSVATFRRRMSVLELTPARSPRLRRRWRRSRGRRGSRGTGARSRSASERPPRRRATGAPLPARAGGGGRPRSGARAPASPKARGSRAAAGRRTR